jgi:vanillate/3-O-methylgallate O-demethylase
MRDESLEGLLTTVASPVELLRNSQSGPRIFPIVPPQFSNWIDEQLAWRESCALFDLSHHMADLFIEGPDVIRLLSDFGVNSFAGFTENKAKHYVACNHDGYVIGDVILYHVGKHQVDVVGRASVHDWLQYNIETQKYDVTTEFDDYSARRSGPPKLFRYQVQGPNARELIAGVAGGPLPEIGFFNIDEIGIARHSVRALRHGMAGQPGLELSGPWKYADDVKGALLEAGRDHGLRQVGTIAYLTAAAESGWIPDPLPAIYTGDSLKAFRQWLPANSYAGTVSLAGSFISEKISDYYLTPYELGYSRYVKFDHDFVGKEALKEIADKPRRQKVTLDLDARDIVRVFESLFGDGDPAKFINLPSMWYAPIQYDSVLKDGEVVGISKYGQYTANERKMLALAIVDAEHSEPGTEVTLLWGEAPNSRKPQVERHAQTEIRATVAPVPYGATARNAYRS